MTNKIYAFLLLVYVGTGLLNGQERLEKQDIIRKVNEEYYAEALPLLESQHRKYPKDPDYLFYTGLCRLQTTSDIPGAIALLKESASLGSPVKSWFYLGRAYMLNYQFTDAEEAFSKF
ncbi:MAG: hypothetical protein HC831_31775 [Chloroflexia bacterium]|nr:hypothetical protein [Chloroflexia bacterium]